MRSVFSFAVMLVASASLAAPAPVWKESPAPQTPFEVMLADLRKTGKAKGPGGIGPDGTWTLTVQKIDSTKLFQPVLICKDRHARGITLIRSHEGKLRLSRDQKHVIVSFGSGELYISDNIDTFDSALTGKLLLTNNR